MRVMVIVQSIPANEGQAPDTEMFEAMGRYNEELVNAGIMLAGEGLLPSEKGHRVLFDGAERRVVDGPFTESKELVAGFWLWDVRSMDEAIEWVKRCPNPGGGESQIEIRQVAEVADFSDELTPELREAMAERRERLGEQQQ